MRNLLIVVILSIAVIGCGTLQKTTTVSTSGKTMEINTSGIYTKPLVADLKVQEAKIETTVEGKSLLPENVPSLVSNLKKSAVSQAIQINKCDILIEPMYTVKIEGTNVSVTVSGRPATYVNFRNLTAADSSAVKLRNAADVNDATGIVENSSISKKGGVGKIFLVSLGLIIVLALVL